MSSPIQRVFRVGLVVSLLMPGLLALAPPAAAQQPSFSVQPLAPTLSKAEVFARTAPATVILIAAQENRWSTAMGVVVSPNGVIVSDSRLISGVEKGKVHAFLYDPSLSGDEDPLLCLRANMKQ